MQQKTSIQKRSYTIIYPGLVEEMRIVKKKGLFYCQLYSTYTYTSIGNANAA